MIPARFTFLGGYDPAYPRNAVIRRGLRQNGAVVDECAEPPGRKFWLRYPLLVRRAIAADRTAAGTEALRRYLFVPEFCAKDVPLARLLSWLSARPVVFDPLAARYETKILDWRRRPPSSLAAWWNFRIDALSFRLASLILADTAAHKDYYCRTYGLNPSKVEVLPLGCDDAFFRPPAQPQPARPGGAFEVLFFGSFLPLHGVETIVEAAKLLAKETDVRFRLIGGGQTEPRVRAYVAKHGLRNVEFAGRVPLSSLPREIARAGVCLGIFGRTEKARRVVPHKVFQALAVGAPVVTARTPAVEEFFTHRENIYLCDEPFAGSLALAVLELKRDAALREGLGAAGARLIRERYSARMIGRRLLEILESRRRARRV